MRSISEPHPNQHEGATANRESCQNALQSLKLVRTKKRKKNCASHKCNNKPVHYPHRAKLVCMVTHGVRGLTLLFGHTRAQGWCARKSRVHGESVKPAPCRVNRNHKDLRSSFNSLGRLHGLRSSCEYRSGKSHTEYGLCKLICRPSCFLAAAAWTAGDELVMLRSRVPRRGDRRYEVAGRCL
jgi:hypothetical protein